MTIDEASGAIWDEVHGEPWFRCVGVGYESCGPVVHLYVARAQVAAMRKRFPGVGGFIVRVFAMGKVRATAA